MAAAEREREQNRDPWDELLDDVRGLLEAYDEYERLRSERPPVMDEESFGERESLH
jgi:hypothetical protein